MEKEAYEVWVLGDMGTDNADYEQHIATFNDNDTACWFAENYPFTHVDNAHITVEHVKYHEDGYAECIDVITEIQM